MIDISEYRQSTAQTPALAMFRQPAPQPGTGQQIPFQQAASQEAISQQAASQQATSQPPADVLPEAYAPDIITMKQFILEKYQADLVREVNQMLLIPEMAHVLGVPAITAPLPGRCFGFKRFSYWRCNHDEIIVDITIRISAPHCQTTACLSLLFYLWDDFSFEVIGLEPKQPEHDELELELDEYLIPYLSWKNLEKYSEQIWHDYLPMVFSDARYLRAYRLAERMGLKIEYRKLYKKNHIRSMLFFCEKEIQIEDRNGCPETVMIPEKTIVLNEKVVKSSYSGLDIYHECTHWDWHYMFFRLQEMCCTDLGSIPTIKAKKTNTKAMRAIWRIEWQARQGSIRVMMPERLFRPWVINGYAETPDNLPHEGYRYQIVGFAIGKEHCLPYARVRGRMVQLGYRAAKGALNWVDGAYIEPFAFDCDKSTGNQTYVVDRDHVFDLYKRDEAFRNLLHEGKYVFADGHVCLNDEKYVYQTTRGARLTQWANAHVDRCCLRFEHIWATDVEEEYELGCLYSCEEYNRLYFLFVDQDGINDIEVNRQKVMEINKAICGCSFPKALAYLMTHGARTYTSQELENASWVSYKTIDRYLEEPKRTYDTDRIIALCVGMHLPPIISYNLLDIARCSIGFDDYGFSYRFVLDALFMDSMEQVQATLKEKRLIQLNIKDRYALAETK